MGGLYEPGLGWTGAHHFPHPVCHTPVLSFYSRLGYRPWTTNSCPLAFGLNNIVSVHEVLIYTL